MITSISLGRISAGEKDLYLCQPGALLDPSNTMGVLYCHGGGADAFEARQGKSPGIVKIITELARRYVVVSADLGGTRTYGNDTVIARVGAARDYMLNTIGVKPGKIHMIGASMGAQSAFVYARANPTHVASIAGLLPLCDLTDIHTNNRAGAAADIDTAYGGSYSEAVYGAEHNPATFASQLTMPLHLWYANDDTAVIAQTVLDLQADAPDCLITDVGALGHTPAAISATSPSAVASFMWSNNS